jgi:hypothetical protein
VVVVVVGGIVVVVVVAGGFVDVVVGAIVVGAGTVVGWVGTIVSTVEPFSVQADQSSRVAMRADFFTVYIEAKSGKEASTALSTV